ncbi:MAG: HAD-IIIC family phosphatase [Candidatus Eremiobacteraeota bacterium]|nr:HAD-IIIC family phosphatase [Candidatus Eremiobacteraeota bacterium]
MYEAEANGRVESADQVPTSVLECFHELTPHIVSKTSLPWSEHCTECVAPKCYATCDLYAPRADLKCRRFTDGMVRIDDAKAVNGYLLKIRFKRWGQLWSYGNTNLSPASKAKNIERGDRLLGSLIFKSPMPQALRRRIIRRRYADKRDHVLRPSPSQERPNCFVVECYNPHDRPIALSLSIMPADQNIKIQFNRMITLQPGYTRERIPTSEISRAVDLRSPFYVSIIPNDIADGTALYFGLLDFVRDQSLHLAGSQTKVKCVVWDLDNTLWDGTLLEDGVDRLRLRPEAVAAIKELDRRGILNSVASKNEPGEVSAVLQRFGVAEYFLHPQISWGPKSAAVERIARALNIGVDTLLFIDDSEFERSEVQHALPEVRTLSASEIASLREREDCDVSVTAVGSSRRLMYQAAIVREAAADSFGSDYLSFLKDCRIELHIAALSEPNLERVHELTQRTNQMNFSGNLYSRGVLREIIRSNLSTYVLDCRDRFGSYGTVGFCIVDPAERRVTDLMFSCRIQSKRLEHAFLTYLLKEMMRVSPADVSFTYKKTPRNEAAGKVFQDFGMELVEETNGVATLVFRADRTIPDDQLVEISEGAVQPAYG